MRSALFIVALLTFVTLAPFFTPTAAARPVSFYKGWTLMSENRADQNEGMIAYTVLPEASIGVHYSAYRLSDGNRQFAVGEATWLVERLSLDGAQVNAYLSGGYGLQRIVGKSYAGSVIAAEADWETRTLYASGRFETMGLAYGTPLAYGRARAGFAPYLAEFEALHTLVILQVDHRSWTDRWTVTPMLRLLYRNVLIELGASLEGETAINWTIEL